MKKVFKDDIVNQTKYDIFANLMAYLYEVFAKYDEAMTEKEFFSLKKDISKIKKYYLDIQSLSLQLQLEKISSREFNNLSVDEQDYVNTTDDSDVSFLLHIIDNYWLFFRLELKQHNLDFNAKKSLQKIISVYANNYISFIIANEQTKKSILKKVEKEGMNTHDIYSF